MNHDYDELLKELELDASPVSWRAADAIEQQGRDIAAAGRECAQWKDLYNDTVTLLNAARRECAEALEDAWRSLTAIALYIEQNGGQTPAYILASISTINVALSPPEHAPAKDDGWVVIDEAHPLPDDLNVDDEILIRDSIEVRSERLPHPASARYKLEMIGALTSNRAFAYRRRSQE